VDAAESTLVRTAILAADPGGPHGDKSMVDE
jgi:hypothetical protein